MVDMENVVIYMLKVPTKLGIGTLVTVLSLNMEGVIIMV